jgi:hypothetical protein
MGCIAILQVKDRQQLLIEMLMEGHPQSFVARSRDLAPKIPRFFATFASLYGGGARHWGGNLLRRRSQSRVAYATANPMYCACDDGLHMRAPSLVLVSERPRWWASV